MHVVGPQRILKSILPILSHGRKANPDKQRASSRAWEQRNRDKCRARWHKRRARIKGNGGEITAEQWSSLKEQYNYTCLKCGRKEPEIRLTLDHVVPIARGGKNTIDNAQPLCKPCNSGKGARFVDYRVDNFCPAYAPENTSRELSENERFSEASS